MVVLHISNTEPSGHPSELKIVNQTATFVTFEWNKLKCHQENGPITGYEYRAYYDPFHYTEGTLDQSTTTYTVYSANIQAFSVAAINKAGIGVYCPPLQIPSFFLGAHILYMYWYLVYSVSVLHRKLTSYLCQPHWKKSKISQRFADKEMPKTGHIFLERTIEYSANFGFYKPCP